MKKILVVDDNEQNRYILEKLFEASQLIVISAENGKIALEKAYANPPDLIVSDILMPVMDGFSLCKIWKTNEQLKHIPFIFYTATYTEPKDEKFAMKLGADLFVIKPQEPHILMELLKNFLEEDNKTCRAADNRPLGSEMEIFRQYNEILFKKLEKKMLDLENVNQRLNREIEEHKKTEENLKRLTQAMEESPVAIFITDLQGNIEYANPKFSQLNGYSNDEIIGKNHSTLRSKEIPPELYSEIAQNLVAGNIWRGELCNRKKNGELFWEYVTVSPVRNDAGEIINYMVVQEDLSERRKLEEQLRQAQKLEGIGQLASGVAHDFNNILMAILGYASLTSLNMQPDDPLKLNVQKILEYSEKASMLTKSLLAFSREQATNLTNFNLNSLVNDFQTFLRPLLREDIEMQTICTKDILAVKADKGQIEQVIMNLATNARDAMPDGGHLIIATNLVELNEEFVKTQGYGKPGQYAEISATDTGSGMDQKTIEKIFEPFFTTKEQGKGTGLGLAVVYGIVRKHNGYIITNSEPGKGTTFKIMLPKSSSDKTDEEETPQESSLQGGKETILLAEDEPGIRDLLSLVLDTHGYHVISAENGEEAVLKFKENKETVDLVILDGIMPKKSGKEAFQEIKVIHPKIKTIFVSGYPQDLLDFEGMEGQEVNCLQKPVRPAELLKKVREILDNTNS